MADNGQKTHGVKRFNKVASYKQIFNSEAGKRVLEDMMTTHWVLSSTYSGEDTHEAAFKEGERAVVIRILKLIQLDLAQMQKYIEEIEKNAGRNSSNDPTQWQ